MKASLPISRKYFPSMALTLLITLHAFLMNGHHHLHQYLPVGTYLDPIVAKADPSLLSRSLYVEAVKRTQVKLSIIDDLYPIIYKNMDFETFAIALELVSLFWILTGIFSLSMVLYPHRTVGYLAMLLYTAELNKWTLGSPAPYANFFHHSIPFAYPLILWSMVFFLRKRYAWSCLLAGFSWSFHPMCTVFLLFSYCIYGIVHFKEFTPKVFFSALVAFAIPASSTILKATSYMSHGTPADPLWITVIRWTAWYTCFPSLWPPLWITRASLFLLLFILALLYLPRDESRKNILTLSFAIGILCLLGTVFAEVYPIPFIIKLSLWRSTLIYLFLALPCIAYLLTVLLQQGIGQRFLAIALALHLSGYLSSFKLYYLPLLIVFLAVALFPSQFAGRFSLFKERFSSLLFISLALLLMCQASFDSGSLRLLTFFAFTLTCLLTEKILGPSLYKRYPTLLWIVPLVCIALGDLGILYHRGGPAIYYHGYLQGKPDPWADIQKRAREVSKKDDLFIIPPYLNNFGVYSLRATLGDWAEGGNALYLDQQFAHEWFSRMEAIGWRKLHGSFEGYNLLSTEEICAAAQKYGARFVISEKPKTFNLQHIYENDRFILYDTSLPTFQ